MRIAYLIVPLALVVLAFSSGTELGRVPAPRAVPLLETVKLGPGLRMLTGGADGNVLVVSGDDGTLLIDARSPDTAEELIVVVDALDLPPVRWLVNTHFHEDHRGANAHYAGQGALVIAHAEARRLMQVGETVEALGWTLNAASAETLPYMTTTAPMTLHVAGRDLELLPLPPGHTSSDLAVIIESADVIHTGDQFELGSFPFLDIWHGGTLNGLIAGVDQLIELAGEDTVIAPGHGPASNRAKLIAYRNMLVGVSETIDDAVDNDFDLPQFIASKPTEPWNDRWGGVQSGQRFAAIAFLEATGQR
jgi:glyoxylase-like metal-dependent hydrolase (beta-lactamase superfamily II)